MATLPDVPSNTIATVAVLVVGGLVAFSTHNRTKLESQIHENYRHAKIVDANIHAGADIPSLPQDRPTRTA